MQVVRGYKTELDPNNVQRTALLKHAGCARFAYNWGLARSKEVYRTMGKRPSPMGLHKELNAMKQTDFPWMYECVRHEVAWMIVPASHKEEREPAVPSAV